MSENKINKKAAINELGHVGQKRWGGYFYEEFLPELRGKKGIEVYKEMADNDDVIGSVIFAIEMLIRQANWSIQPGGTEKQDIEAAEFVESCMYDMSETWIDTLSEILSFLTYGWSFHEIVYKRRCGKSNDNRLNSKYNDGMIGWAKLPIRSQETLWRWEYDDSDNLTGMTQLPPPSYTLCTIPIEKAMLFRTKSRKNNPEGRSILRNCYRDWYFKKRIQEIEGVGIERDLAGFPVLQAPEGLDIWNSEDPDMAIIKSRMDAIVKNVRRDSTEGLSLPFGWTFNLVTTGGKRTFDTNQIIERYDNRMAMTVMADFIFLGHESVGSFALSSDKTQLFADAIGAYLDIICETFNNQAIPRLINLNGDHFNAITAYPEMIHGDIEDADIEKLGTFIKDMTGVGVLTPDSQLEDYVRDAAHLPERIEDVEGEGAKTAPRAPQKPTAPGEEKDPDEQTDEDKKAVEEAKKRLGR